MRFTDSYCNLCVSGGGGREDMGDVSAILESRKGLAKGGEWLLTRAREGWGVLFANTCCKHVPNFTSDLSSLAKILLNTSTFAHMHTHTHTHVLTNTHVHIYTHESTYIYTHTYIHIYIHIYIQL